MTSLSETLVGTIMGASAIAFAASNASAGIACTGNVCWHTHEVYEYPGEAHVIIHPDDWHWGASERYVWREHKGPGYWRDDDWVEFEPD
jgi:hypothetical protein